MLIMLIILNLYAKCKCIYTQKQQWIYEVVGKKILHLYNFFCIRLWNDHS